MSDLPSPVPLPAGTKAPMPLLRKLSTAGSYKSQTSTFSSKAAVAIPAIIHWQGRVIKASIDNNVPTQEIVAQLCQSQHVNLQEPAALFCLRDYDNDELINDDNVHLKLEQGAKFKLVESPVIFAAEMVEKLATRDEKIVKLATFELKKYVGEPVFIEEFISRGGLTELIACIESASGNTLAYALTSCQSLLENQRGREALDQPFIRRIIHIYTTQSLVNIARPAAGILRRLAMAPPLPIHTSHASTSSLPAETTSFTNLWSLIKEESSTNFFKMTATHLKTADHLLIAQSISLLATLTANALRSRTLDFYLELEENRIRECVCDITDSQIKQGALIPTLVEFQNGVIGFTHLLTQIPVNFDIAEHASLLKNICQKCGLSMEAQDQLTIWGLNQPGCYTKMGYFGLRTLSQVSESASKELTTFLASQLNLIPERQCPIGYASNIVLEYLANIWGITDGQPSSSLPSPLLLNYIQVHKSSLLLFCKMWAESDSSRADFDRLANLLDGFLSKLIGEESQMKWEQLDSVFTNSTYKAIRDKQLDEAAVEDELLSKAPIRNLRSRLYEESYDIVKKQRVDCLMKGAWFMHSTSDSSPSLSKDSKRNTLQTRWRFYRLASNKRMLHYCDSTERTNIRPGLLDLPNSIDIQTLTDILPSSAPKSVRSPLSASFNVNRPTSATSTAVNLAFTLHTASGVLAELKAQDVSTYAEWIDGLSLSRENGYIHTKETADLIQALTDIGVKVKLLDMTGEQVQIPPEVKISRDAYPAKAQYYYSEC